MLVVLLEAAVALGETEAVRELLPRLAGLADLAGTAGNNLTCIGRHLGAGAALLGDRAGARGYCGQALAIGAKLEFRPEVALTRLQMAELLFAEADDLTAGVPLPDGDLRSEAVIRKEALEHLDFAIAEFTVMKMTPSLERALSHKGLLKA